MLLFNLDILGVACSGGSACASGGSRSSHVLQEILPDSKRPGIRFSFSKYNTKEDIDFAIDKLIYFNFKVAISNSHERRYKIKKTVW